MKDNLSMTSTKANIQVGKRIVFVRKNIAQQTQEEFGKGLGVSRGAVGNWELGQGIGLEKMRAIVERYPDVSLDWLSTGRGNAPEIHGRSYVENPDESDATEAGDLGYVPGHYVPRVAGALPEIDVSLGAGEGNVGDTLVVSIGNNGYSGHRVTAEWIIPEDFLLQEVKATKARTIIMPVVGDSMFPTYNYGDRVFIDLAQNRFLQDAVYAISDGQSAPQIKRLNHVFNSSPKRVRIISDNQAYPTEEFPLSDVVIIGRVCGVVARR